MDEETFKLIDGLLAGQQGADGRETAKAIFEVAQKGDNMRVAAEVIGRRFAIRPEAILGWYAKTLEREAAEALKRAGELMKQRGGNDGD